MKMHKPRNLTFKIVTNSIIVLFCICCILPMILTISVSLSSARTIFDYGYTLLPIDISFDSYRLIFANPVSILTGYRNSIFLTVVGTVINLIIITLVAYPLSNLRFAYRSIINKFIFITMIFSGGTVSMYILISRYLQLKDTLWALILIPIAAPFHIFLMRVFFQEVPVSLIESAKLDGSSEMNTFLKIAAPLCKPGIATIGLMIALGYWNEANNALLYIDSRDKYPIQLTLNNLASYINVIKSGALEKLKLDMSQIPSDGMMFAMVVVSTAPVLFLFSFFQKYFVKGITAGGVKG